MNAQDNTELVIKKLYRLVSECDPYPRNPNLLILNKKEFVDLLEELSNSVDALYAEYEMTRESREKAEREARRRNEAAIAETSKRTEDIYAASMLYSNDALERVWEIMHDATASMEKIYEETEEKLRHQEKKIRSNQTELKAQLQDMKDAERYMGLIEESHKEEEREKIRERAKMRARKNEAGRYANRQTEVRVNQEVLERLGFTEDAESLAEAEERAKPKQKDMPVIRVNEQYDPKKKPELSRKKKAAGREDEPVFADSLKRMKPDDFIIEDLEDMVTEETEITEASGLPLKKDDIDYLDDDTEEGTDFSSEEFVRPAQRQEVSGRMNGMTEGMWKGSGSNRTGDDIQPIDLNNDSPDSAAAGSGDEAKKKNAKKTGKRRGFWSR